MTGQERGQPDPQRPGLRPDQVSDVAMALLTLSHEVWATQDRMRMLEAVLESHGIDANEQIDRFQPSPELAAEQAQKANAFVARIIGALSGQAPANPKDLG
jgi:hypothetical protein